MRGVISIQSPPGFPRGPPHSFALALDLGAERYAPNASSRVLSLRPETFSIQSVALFPSLPRALPRFGSVQSLTDKQVVPASETSLPSEVDGATGVQNPLVSPVYSFAPPIYSPIAGVRARENGIAHNLMTDFVDMNNSEGFGVIMNLGELMAWIVSRD